MPAYKLNGRPLVYFAGFKNHIGFYATPIPIDEPLPFDLVKRIVLFRVNENMSKGEK